MHRYVPSCLSPKSMFFKTFPRKGVLICLRKELVKYFLQFQETLKKHLTTEFEVELQDGSISASGRKVLTDLHNDHEILQYDVRIDEMCIHVLKKLKYNAPHQIQELLNCVKDDIAAAFRKLMLNIQQTVLRERRQNDNALKKVKCSQTSLVHNFTTVKLPLDLLEYLET